MSLHDFRVDARHGLRALGLIMLMAVWGQPARADNNTPATFKHIPMEYIVALGDPAANSGSGAEGWGLWHQDPGPRGCLLKDYEALKTSGGIAPSQWKYDEQDWWLEEHGLIMEKPVFPLSPGKYVVTGGRDATAVLTVHPVAQDGTARWELSSGAKLDDVTHRPCHAARYTPADNTNSCSPTMASSAAFPVAPGVSMPAVKGCNKQEYSVLFVIGVAVDDPDPSKTEEIPMNVHSFGMQRINGETQSLADYKGKVVLIVNTASRCGFTPQYQGLEELYLKYKDRGFVVLAFPANNFMGQEPGSNEEIKGFCELKYKTTFPLFAKTSVLGADINPLFKYLTEEPAFKGPVTWNFNKFLVDGSGRVIARYDSRVKPLDSEVIAAVEKALGGDKDKGPVR